MYGIYKKSLHQYKLTNKNFPIWCNVNFVSVFTALNNTKSKENWTLYHMRKFLLVNFLG